MNDYKKVSKKRENLKRLSLKSLIGIALQDYYEADWLSALEIRYRGNADTVACMQKLFKSRNWKKRYLAVFVMGQLFYLNKHHFSKLTRFGIADSEKMLVAALADSNPYVNAVALSQLSFTPVAAALPTMLNFVDHPNSFCRESLAFALIPFNNEGTQVTEALLQLADDEVCSVKDWATFALQESEIDNAVVRACLWKNAHDQDKLVVNEAMQGLAKRQDKRVVALILEYLNNGQYCNESALLEVAELYADPVLIEKVKNHIEKNPQ
ncbi:hypothetical protein J3U64_06630 [Snodgrassella sp. B3800]|uniref:hypothetical protein n=1 Tax=Snodgrassella sp. B3800 TaxID=2818039 RepID=UPI0022699C4D|nr:hypothetical protein [Snodgrassella sp. B3800]MCX8747138.1 hypothetical protein [Snodgrassella sp. B3800]